MELSSRTKPPCLHVFAIPELAHMICKQARKRDNVSLLRVCRQLFHDICPLVWESTDAIVTLVSMIPGAGIELQGDALLPTGILTVVMQLPSSLDLSRFNVYAPYIKRLEIPLKLDVDEYENWDGFLAATRSTSLLPNLEHIYMPLLFDSGADQVANAINWVTAFLSPSLLSLTTLPSTSYPIGLDPDRSWVGLQLAQNLLNDISQLCPRLGTLRIFPGDVSVEPYGHSRRHVGRYSRTLNVNFFCSSPEMFPIISQLGNLRTLTTTPFILNGDIFLALAQLPSLESFFIYGLRSHRQAYGSDLKLPNQAFLSLRHLELQFLTWETIRNLCGQKSLWQGLRTIRIHGLRSYQGFEVDDDPHLFSGIISALEEHRSPVTALSLIGATRQWIGPQMINSLKRLPLNSLWIGEFDENHSDLKGMLSASPELEELGIHMERGFQLSHLRLIIPLLPRLRRLYLPKYNQSPEYLHWVDIAPSRSYSKDCFHLESNFHVGEAQRESAEKIARYLRAVDPHMVSVPLGPDVHFFSGVHWVNPMDVLINEALSRLRKASAR